MKKSYLFLCLILILGINVQGFAQVDPGTTNLKHQWTFDDGTANDYIGHADGVLQGSGNLVNNTLVLTGGYLDLPASQIALSTYSEMTMEIWFASQSGANAGWRMFTYFGETNSGGAGQNFFFMTPINGFNNSRACISTVVGAVGEEGVNSSGYDDGILHQFVATVTGTQLEFYVDGNWVGSQALSAGNILANISSSLAYLGKGGFTADPTWKGSIQKFSIYDKALLAENVAYLFGQGAESKPSIVASISNISLESTPENSSKQFFVTSANLEDDITVQAPTGITVIINGDETITKIPKNTTAADVLIFLNEDAGNIKDTLYLRSGDVVVKIPVFALNTGACSKRLYDAQFDNMIGDFSCSNLSTFAGWGTKEVVNASDFPENVFCGATSIKVGDGLNASSGSLDYRLSDNNKIMLPNTTYRVKAMIKTIGGSFNIGLWGWDATKGDFNAYIDTNGEWKALDFTFTTGATVGANQGTFFNNCTCAGCTGLEAYIDNWEMYESQDQILKTSLSNVYLDLDTKNDTILFTVNTSKLKNDIIVTLPQGLTTDKITLPSTAQGDTVKVTWDGSTAVDGNIVLSSDTVSAKIAIKATLTNGSGCFTPKYADKVNGIPDPYCNFASKFSGWGGKSILQSPDSAYCGNRCGYVKGVGSFDVVTADSAKAYQFVHEGRTYLARAMVKTYGGDFNFGMYGVAKKDATGTVKDKVFTIASTEGVWQQVEYSFEVDSVGAYSGLYFNNAGTSGTAGLIDNMELYDMGATGVNQINNFISSIYLHNGNIMAEFDANKASNAQLIVYNIQGAEIANQQFNCNSGRNRISFNMNLAPGMYVVCLNVDGKNEYRKLIK